MLARVFDTTAYKQKHTHILRISSSKGHRVVSLSIHSTHPHHKRKSTHPIAAIAHAPNSKLPSASACRRTELRQRWASITKSPASISTHAAWMIIPVGTADVTP